MSKPQMSTLLDESTSIPHTEPVQHHHTCSFPDHFNAYYTGTYDCENCKIDRGMRVFIANHYRHVHPELTKEIETIVDLVYTYHRNLHRYHQQHSQLRWDVYTKLFTSQRKLSPKAIECAFLMCLDSTS
jgi:hypothetical protein